MTTPSSSEAVRPARRSVSDRVLGAVGGAMILLALVYLVAGVASDGEAAVDEAAVPALALLEPAAGDTLAGPLTLLFTAPEALGPQPTGWGADMLHLHAGIGGREFMPSSADIQRLGDGRFRWTLGVLEPGEHEVRLFWSDHEHRPIEAGAAPAVRVVVPAGD